MKKETVMKCFQKAGITSSDFSVVGGQYEDEDPFVDLDGQDELQSLIDQISHSETCCDVDEYINGEDDMPVCMEYDNDWEDHFFAGLNPNSDTSLPEDLSLQENPNEEEEEFDLERPPQKIKMSQYFWILKDTLRRQQFHPL